MAFLTSSPLISIQGAGVVGLACAVRLLQRGARVILYEKAARLGASACSWYAGGMLAPWCERELGEELLLTLGQEALSFWPEMYPATQKKGTLVVALARDIGELSHFARKTSGYRWVEADQIAHLEPLLANRFTKGLFFPEEMHLDPRAALQALAQKIIALGGIFHFNWPETAPIPSVDYHVDCRGLVAQDILKDLRGVRGEMLHIYAPEIHLSRPIRLLHPRIPLYIVPRAQGVFMIGATMIESESRAPMTLRSMMELAGAAYALHPLFAQAHVIELGADARPAFPSNIPHIHQEGNSFCVNGFYRHGFLLAPAFATRLAHMILPEGENG